MTIAAILSTKGGEVATVPAGTRVRDAVLLLKDKRIGAVPVIDGGAIVGIFSERDLVGCLCQHGADALDMAVDAGMSSPALTIESDTPVLAALSIMTNQRIRHLPVIEFGRDSGNCVDRRPREAPDRADRGRGGSAAELHPKRLTAKIIPGFAPFFWPRRQSGDIFLK